MKSILKIYNDKITDLNKNMYGIFFEDINYSADGGLYCELLENRSFEFVKALGDKNDYYQEQAYDYGWSIYPDNCTAEFEICGTLNTYTGAKVNSDDEIWDKTGLNKNNPHYLKFTATEKMQGFKNKAFDGVYLKKGQEYLVSFYAKSENYFGGIKISVGTENGTYAEADFTDTITNEWKKYSAKITADCDCAGASFIVRLTECGSVCFDMFSLKPTDAVCGIFRKDMFEMLKGLNPGFIRFPGGCIVEGNTLDNRYKWKDTLGDVSERKAQWSRWATHNEMRFPYYNQSFGIGYFEYFMLCELLGAEPMPIVNVGVACEYQSDEKVDINDAEFDWYINDTFDLIEFANSTDFENSKWARIRRDMGHEQPFNLKYIGIGNEQWEGKTFAGGTYVDYFARYEKFENAIHEKYPEINLIGCAGETNSGEHYDAAWEFFGSKNEKYVAMVDEHYYTSTEWMINNTDFYDKYDRTSGVKVFAGEYAAGGNTWMDALSEAAYMTGMENNGDIVRCASYAPLFARDGFTQWTRANLIMFNETAISGTPNYYVQSMFSNNKGDYVLKSEYEGDDGIFNTVSYDKKTGETIIKLVNVTDKAVDIDICCDTERTTGKLICLTHDNINAKNNTGNPKEIYPKERNIDISNGFTSLPYSVSIIRL